jgi:dTDP-glucose 4,6-dehydratase
MRLLVTGGAGFIGSAFVRRRLEQTADSIVVLDKLTYAGDRRNLSAVEASAELGHRIRFVEGDIADPVTVEPLVAGADAVLNFASATHVDRSIEDAGAFLQTGVIGVHVLLEAVRAASLKHGRPVRLVQVSTDEVYGSIDDGAWTESAPVAPRSPYAAAKAAGDLLCLAYHATHGTDVVISRGANTYGPHQHPEKLIPLFVTNALDDHPLPLYGDGLQRRDWLHVHDHADAVALLLERGVSGRVYNVPGGGERSNREVTEVILRTLGRPWSLVRSVSDRPGHDRRYAMVGSRIAELGWRPSVDLDQGLAETADWYRDNRWWWEPLRDARWAEYYERLYGRRLAESRPA